MLFIWRYLAYYKITARKIVILDRIDRLVKLLLLHLLYSRPADSHSRRLDIKKRNKLYRSISTVLYINR